MGNGARNQIDIQVDQNASQILLGVVPDEKQYTWKMFFPDAEAPSEAGNLKRLGSQFMRIVKTKGSHSATEPFIYYGMDTVTGWSLELDAIQDMITLDDVSQFNGDRGMAEQNGQEVCKIVLWNRGEFDAIAAFEDNSVFTNYNDLSGVGKYPWTDKTNATPFDDINAGINTIADSKVGKMPNKCAMSLKTWRNLREHPQAFVKLGTTFRTDRTAPMSVEEFKSYFGFDEVRISNNQYNAAALGIADDWTPFWGATFMMAYVDPNPQPNVMSAQYSLGYDFKANYGVFKSFGAIVADSYEINSPKGASVARTMYKHDMLVVSADAGFPILNTY